MKIDSNFKCLFTSQTRLKLISIFFYSPQEMFFVRQLVRLTGEEINSVRRELANLLNIGIIQSEQRSNKVFYWANLKSSLISELLIIANKNYGLGQELHKKSGRSGDIKMFFASYNYILNLPYNPDLIDMIVVGDASFREIDSLVKEEEKRREREINYMLMDKNELILRKQKRDQFIVDFFLGSPLVIIGNPKEITSLK